jgi:uncharacterized protein YecT (DUF1311 family)
MKRIFIGFCIYFSAFGVFAGEGGVVKEDDWDLALPYKKKCTESSQVQQNMCLANAYGEVDSRLNAVYSELIDKLDAPDTLREAQRAWIIFRDKDCEFANSGLGKDGSLYRYAHTACLINSSEKRIRDLRRYLSWGDCNGCPHYKYP